MFFPVIFVVFIISRNEFKKDLDTKMKIAKKVFSSKTEKNPKKNPPQARTSNTISSSVELKMKRTPSTNVRPKINRNIVNTQLTR